LTTVRCSVTLAQFCCIFCCCRVVIWYGPCYFLRWVACDNSVARQYLPVKMTASGWDKVDRLFRVALSQAVPPTASRGKCQSNRVRSKLTGRDPFVCAYWQPYITPGNINCWAPGLMHNSSSLLDNGRTPANGIHREKNTIQFSSHWKFHY
jgi:hypothetical protein